MLTWMSYIVMFLTGRRTARHLLTSSEFGRQRNFLISMKADLRQTPISSCSPSFCIVLVGVGFLEKQISELNSHSLMNLLFLPLLNYFLFNCAPGHLTSPSSLHWRLPRLYCLYCHCECQPYKPQFKIYLSSHVLFYLATCLLWSCVSDRCNWDGVGHVMLKYWSCKFI